VCEHRWFLFQNYRKAFTDKHGDFVCLEGNRPVPSPGAGGSVFDDVSLSEMEKEALVHGAALSGTLALVDIG
jgi:hypothetical protein